MLLRSCLLDGDLRFCERLLPLVRLYSGAGDFGISGLHCCDGDLRRLLDIDGCPDFDEDRSIPSATTLAGLPLK